ncbi:MAG: cytochrome c oxidase subunit 3 [Bacteroidota bacterium]|jgi:cytochrome c oxidase subunit 3
MAGHVEHVSKDELWGGNRSPFSVSYGKMMMWYFLVSDALTFGGLLTAYGFIRHSSSEPWPVGEQVFESLPGLHGSYPLMYVALMTFILIVSSVTMVLAVEAGHRMDKKGVVKWLGLTIIGGFFFLGSQAWEWSHFIHGSGGGFQITEPIKVMATDDHGTTYEMQLASGTWVHMTSDFGHEYEHAKEMAEASAHESNGHDDHAEHASVQHTDPNTMVPEVLILNKYTLEHKDGKDLRKLEVKGDEAKKLWAIKGEEAFGAPIFTSEAHDGMKKNEYASQQQYANFFFFVTGFHGFHVFSGVVINIIIWLMAIRGIFEKRGHYEMIEKIGLYWHFVDLVWVFVFTFFYLI